MIETITLRKQTPSDPTGWLYEETDNGRVFKKIVCLGDNAEPWHECTDEDKAAYEAEWNATHPTEESGTPDSEVPEEGLKGDDDNGVTDIQP